MCAVWFWRWCVQGKRRVLHSQGGAEDQGQGSCFLLQSQVQEVALPLMHHQAKAQGWLLWSPSVSCRGCSDLRGGLHDQGAACYARKGPDSGMMWWCDDVMNWMWQHVLSLSFGLLLVNWIWLFMVCRTESMVMLVMYYDIYICLSLNLHVVCG